MLAMIYLKKNYTTLKSEDNIDQLVVYLSKKPPFLKKISLAFFSIIEKLQKHRVSVDTRINASC